MLQAIFDAASTRIILREILFLFNDKAADSDIKLELSTVIAKGMSSNVFIVHHDCDCWCGESWRLWSDEQCDWVSVV